jgi:para-nitrobenzyl esterase
VLLSIETSTGVVRGIARGEVRMWKGIPYAAAPVGALRFSPPQPAPRVAERDASRAGPVAVQTRNAMLGGVGPDTLMSEDCLTVNVVAPAEAKQCPVVVWIHGGAFVMGSGSMPQYDGTSFAARHGIVVVTINYRLGLLGSLYLGELGGDPAGNVFLLDQIAALGWVHREIAAFGGDPDRVTVMGESAGAVSIAALLAAPVARGLFQQAILQSGAAAFEPPTRDEATERAKRILAALGIAETNLGALADAPAATLLGLQDELMRERGLAAFGPFVDGVTLPEAPLHALRSRSAAQVPVVVGTNRDEWALFDLFLPDTTAALVTALRRRLGDKLDAIRHHYRSWVELCGDVAFRIPMLRLAEAHAAPVYMYRFDVASQAFGGKLGSGHALELPFVWNQLDLPIVPMLLGSDVSPYRPIARAMHDAWAAFIRCGVPGSSGVPLWPCYDTARRATLVIDGPSHPSRVAEDLGGEHRELWSFL